MTAEIQQFNAAWGVYGHEWAVSHLRKSIANQRVRQAYLFLGAEAIGKDTLAHAFARALNCKEVIATGNPDPCGVCRTCTMIASGSHPDMVYSENDANSGALRIEEVRRVMQQLSLKPFEAQTRIAIFRDFDKAQPRAQDALLKTLEEPPPHAMIFLLATSPDQILPTIHSRSQTLHLRPVPLQTVRDVLVSRGADADQATLLARLSGGRMGWALRVLADPALLDQRDGALDLLEQLLAQGRKHRFDLAQDLSKDKLAVMPLLELWQSYWRDLVLLCEGSGLAPANHDRAHRIEQLAEAMTPESALKALKATAKMQGLLSTNANVRLALEVMFLDYPYISA